MSALLAPLPPEDANVVTVLMLTPTHAVDLFLGDLTRRSRSKSGRTAASYRRILDKFTDYLDRYGDLDVSEITSDHCRGFLDGYVKRAAGTQANVYSILNSFLEWLDQQERIKRNPLDRVRRPRRIAAEDLDVTSVSTSDVGRLIAACKNDAERICVAVLVYTGARRNAVALLRLSDYDADRGRIRFREKGTKTIWKPVPDELAEILDAAIARGVYDSTPRHDEGNGESDGQVQELRPAVAPGTDPYLIPAVGPLARDGERDDRCIWRIVKTVGDRAGVDVHVHALRSAFAVHYLEAHQGDLVGLQELMGHASPETTRIYLRKLDRQKAMEPVRTLSWAVADGGDEFKPLTLLSGSHREEVLDDPVDYVYFIANGDRSRIKIGFSGEPLRRLTDIQTGHHDELGLLLAIPGTRQDEVDLHHRFAANRLRGEWFSASDDLLAYIVKKSNARDAIGGQFADSAFASSPSMGAGGFEPPQAEPSDQSRGGSEPERLAPLEAP